MTYRIQARFIASCYFRFRISEFNSHLLIIIAHLTAIGMQFSFHLSFVLFLLQLRSIIFIHSIDRRIRPHCIAPLAS